MKTTAFFLVFFLSINHVFIASADDNERFWPKEIVAQDATITLYQPQIESFNDNVLEARMALSVQQENEKAVFGAVWFVSKVETDVEERTAVLTNMDIKRIYFPEFDDTQKLEKYTALVTDELGSWDLVMSYDRFSASLSEVEDLKSLSVQINNQPPNIYFRTAPAVLISIDGDPLFKAVEGANLEYVVNTAFFIVKRNNKYYIKGGKFWYDSYQATSGYRQTNDVPADIVKFAIENQKEVEADSTSLNITEAPAIIVATQPSELISTNGEPEYASIKGTKLLYVKNTTSDVVMDMSTQNHYVLLAGRWYYSRSLDDGDWQFIEPGNLPADFAKIPEDSDMATVRASVPGTPEAQDALLEQIIPQTATIDRNTAKNEVQWDGEPQFEKIDGTNISVAMNSDKTVLLIRNKYYCVDDAIWFVADYPAGPWIVSDVRPEEVDQIPPESEAYNVKYVYIYESTPEVVYVGYLPGYTWSYVYDGCVVYGTGYWYKPWYRHYYFPRPVTYGYGVHWNPYTGWGFTYGLYYGWIGWYFHPYARWWGPRGYYPGYRHGYYHGYHHGYQYGYKQGAARGYAAGYHAARHNTYNNVYRNRTTGVRSTASIRTVQANRSIDSKTRPSNRPNNVYTDRNGNVYQRSKNGNWERMDNSRVKSPATRQPESQASDRKASPTAQQPERQANDRTAPPTTRQPERLSKEKTVPPTTRQPEKKTRERTAPQPSSNQQSKSKQPPVSQQQNKAQHSKSISSEQKQQMNKSYQNRNRGTQNYNRSKPEGGKSNTKGGGGNRNR